LIIDYDIVETVIRWSCASFEFVLPMKKKQLTATAVFNRDLMGKK
jgi:hypothetical protein